VTSRPPNSPTISPPFDRSEREQPVACVRDHRRFDDGALVVFFVDLQHGNKIHRRLLGKQRERTATEHQCKKKRDRYTASGYVMHSTPLLQVFH
jgi:hypothetical protein